MPPANPRPMAAEPTTVIARHWRSTITADLMLTGVHADAR
jgi:hypothetical protein